MLSLKIHLTLFSLSEPSSVYHFHSFLVGLSQVLWTEQPCPRFLLLCCAATLDQQSATIMENRFGLTEILKHVNDMSMHHSLDEMLTSAEAIFHQLSASQVLHFPLTEDCDA